MAVNSAIVGNDANAIVGKNITGVNTLDSTNEISLTFTADNASDTPATVLNIPIIPGVGKAAAKTLPAGVTFLASNGMTFAEWAEYSANVPMQILYIDVQATSADTNYGGDNKIHIEERKPSLTSPAFRDIKLNIYRETSGSSILDTAKIRDLGTGLTCWAAFYMSLAKLAKNSSMTFTLGVSHWGQAQNMVPVNF